MLLRLVLVLGVLNLAESYTLNAGASLLKDVMDEEGYEAPSSRVSESSETPPPTIEPRGQSHAEPADPDQAEELDESDDQPVESETVDANTYETVPDDYDDPSDAEDETVEAEADAAADTDQEVQFVDPEPVNEEQEVGIVTDDDHMIQPTDSPLVTDQPIVGESTNSEEVYGKENENPYGEDEVYGKEGENPYPVSQDSEIAVESNGPMIIDNGGIEPEPTNSDEVYGKENENPYGEDKVYGKAGENPYPGIQDAENSVESNDPMIIDNGGIEPEPTNSDEVYGKENENRYEDVYGREGENAYPGSQKSKDLSDDQENVVQEINKLTNEMDDKLEDELENGVENESELDEEEQEAWEANYTTASDLDKAFSEGSGVYNDNVAVDNYTPEMEYHDGEVVNEIEEDFVDIPGHHIQGEFYEEENEYYIKENGFAIEDGLSSWHTITYFLILVVMATVVYTMYNRYRAKRGTQSNYAYTRLGEHGAKA